MVAVIVDEQDCEEVAQKLLNHDYQVPTAFNTSAAQRRLLAQPWVSDLIFNYLCNAMTVDNPQGAAESPSVEETALALSILANLFEIDPDDIAKHYSTRL